jgi:mxaJ protein
MSSVYSKWTAVMRCWLWLGVLLCGALLGLRVFVLHPTAAPETTPQEKRRLLRISADPNNLPFSNQKEEGFENRIARVIARELDADVEYVWHAQRRAFVRESVKREHCDLVMGVPSGYERLLTTRPYYWSSYVFVSRHERALQVKSFDDPRLKRLIIGVQLVGDDGMNTPPAHALSARGIIDNVRGYTVYGDYARANPQSEIIAAVAKGDVDVAIVWGPPAGYFAKLQPMALDLVPVSPEKSEGIPFSFSISIGVSKTEKALKQTIDDILLRRRDEIEAILREAGVPSLEIASNPEEQRK